MTKRAEAMPSGVLIAAAMILIVFIGFAPTFYLNGLFARLPLDTLRILHGIVFSSWPVLLVVQILLIRQRRFSLHRRFGMLGGLIALSMSAIGLLLAVDAAKRGFGAPDLPPAEVFLAIPVFDIVVFAILVSAGIALRHSRADHARLMILATLVLLPAAFARMPLPIPDPILKGFGPAAALLLVVVAVDTLKLNRVQRAWIWGASLFLISIPLRLMIAQTDFWRAAAHWALGQ